MPINVMEAKKVKTTGDALTYFDKVPLKFSNWKEEDFRQAGFRVIPGAIVRYSAYIAKNAVLLP